MTDIIWLIKRTKKCFRLLQQRLQIIGTAKNEQMVISIVPHITLYHAIYSKHASCKSHMIWVISDIESVAWSLTDQMVWISWVYFLFWFRCEIFASREISELNQEIQTKRPGTDPSLIPHIDQTLVQSFLESKEDGPTVRWQRIWKWTVVQKL